MSFDANNLKGKWLILAFIGLILVIPLILLFIVAPLLLREYRFEVLKIILYLVGVFIFFSLISGKGKVLIKRIIEKRKELRGREEYFPDMSQSYHSMASGTHRNSKRTPWDGWRDRILAGILYQGFIFVPLKEVYLIPYFCGICPLIYSVIFYIDKDKDKDKDKDRKKNSIIAISFGAFVSGCYYGIINIL